MTEYFDLTSIIAMFVHENWHNIHKLKSIHSFKTHLSYSDALVSPLNIAGCHCFDLQQMLPVPLFLGRLYIPDWWLPPALRRFCGFGAAKRSNIPIEKNQERDCRGSVKTPLIQSTCTILIAQIPYNFQVGKKNQAVQKNGCDSSSNQPKSSREVSKKLTCSEICKKQYIVALRLSAFQNWALKQSTFYWNTLYINHLDRILQILTNHTVTSTQLDIGIPKETDLLSRGDKRLVISTLISFLSLPIQWLHATLRLIHFVVAVFSLRFRVCSLLK